MTVEAPEGITRTPTYTRFGVSDEEMLRQAEDFGPDVLGISTMFTVYSGDPHRTTKVIKDRHPIIKLTLMSPPIQPLLIEK